MISFVHVRLSYLLLTRRINLAQLGERRPSAERKVRGLNPGRTNTQGLQIIEKKVLRL